jgi:PmbA protein
MNIEAIAQDALKKMKLQGFDAAQVSASLSTQDELNIALNEPSLFRSTEDYSLALMGLVGSRKASVDLTDLSEGNIDQNIAELFERAKVAPEDDANAVSIGQSADITSGPQEGDLDLLAKTVEDLLSYRAAEAPKMNIDEGFASHGLSKHWILTSEGSKLSSSIGCYTLVTMGTAVEGDQSSSFNYTGGSTNDLAVLPAAKNFAIDEMLKETQNQIHTNPLSEKFVGDVVMAPTAVSDLVGWLLGQVSDGQLIAGSSLYKDKVGQTIASNLLTISSHFDGAGQVAMSGDGFPAPSLDLVKDGTLTTLLPSLYGSRKTGLKHTPTGSGWRVEPGTGAKADMIASVGKGALVSRLSMGSPGANGDFSGVIKNSFLIEDGKIGTALSETMISGNVAKMLKDIVTISAEHLDTGGEDLPWIQISDLSFS